MAATLQITVDLSNFDVNVLTKKSFKKCIMFVTRNKHVIHYEYKIEVQFFAKL